jgi:hypothetical protein
MARFDIVEVAGSGYWFLVGAKRTRNRKPETRNPEYREAWRI